MRLLDCSLPDPVLMPMRYLVMEISTAPPPRLGTKTAFILGGSFRDNEYVKKFLWWRCRCFQTLVHGGQWRCMFLPRIVKERLVTKFPTNSHGLHLANWTNGYSKWCFGKVKTYYGHFWYVKFLGCKASPKSVGILWTWPRLSKNTRPSTFGPSTNIPPYLRHEPPPK